MTIDWSVENPLIEAASDDYNVDPAFVKSIREQENGPADDPFGVTKTFPNITHYDDQLRITCITVAHRLVSYTGNPLARGPISRRLMYSSDWIRYFGGIWAPLEASPLNASWIPNVLSFYKKWTTTGANFPQR